MAERCVHHIHRLALWLLPRISISLSLSLQTCIARTWPPQLELRGDEHLRDTVLRNRCSFYSKKITFPSACKVPPASVERERFERIFCASYLEFCSAFTVFCCQRIFWLPRLFNLSILYDAHKSFRDLVAILLLYAISKCASFLIVENLRFYRRILE